MDDGNFPCSHEGNIKARSRPRPRPKEKGALLATRSRHYATPQALPLAYFVRDETTNWEPRLVSRPAKPVVLPISAANETEMDIVRRAVIQKAGKLTCYRSAFLGSRPHWKERHQ